jgi:hypothetical protein
VDVIEDSLAEIYAAYLAVFRSAAESRKDAAIGALGGVYYAFDSERLFHRLMVLLGERVTDALTTSGAVYSELATDVGAVQAWLLEAVLRSVHSSADLLAQSVSQVVLAKPMASDHCNSRSVVDKLRSEARRKRVNRPGLETVACALAAYLDSPEYGYVDAFVNVCKHQSFVQRAYFAGLTNDATFSSQVVLQEFAYRGMPWPQKTTADIAEVTGSLRNRALEILKLAETNAWPDRSEARGTIVAAGSIVEQALPADGGKLVQ